ncbi:hypothetical protein CEXT_768881 [Caerostris extrusa]|uniref:Uncharacterized protein n=1 Tax=Caerostris extrusa TaxID=172846 RepID=A0AAV4V6N1_CAEEX|nr:hypothetical protein CEXT_768881 [Caerostris extrusa]
MEKEIRMKEEYIFSFWRQMALDCSGPVHVILARLDLSRRSAGNSCREDSGHEILITTPPLAGPLLKLLAKLKRPSLKTVLLHAQNARGEQKIGRAIV